MEEEAEPGLGHVCLDTLGTAKRRGVMGPDMELFQEWRSQRLRTTCHPDGSFFFGSPRDPGSGWSELRSLFLGCWFVFCS